MEEKPQTPSEMGKKSARNRFKEMSKEEVSEYMRNVRNKLPLDKRS